MAPPGPCAHLGYQSPAPRYPSAGAGPTTQDRPPSTPAQSEGPLRGPRRRGSPRSTTRRSRQPRRHPPLDTPPTRSATPPTRSAGAPPSPCPRSHASMSTASTPLVLAAEAAGESDIPFCLSGVQGSSGSGCPRGGRVDGAVRGLLVDHEAWEGLDKRAVSTVWINTVDTVSKRVFTWGSSSRNRAPNDCHSLANLSFRDRVRRGGAVGVSVLLADPGSPGSVSGRGSTTDGHSVH
jgi:hypothetical protein